MVEVIACVHVCSTVVPCRSLTVAFAVPVSVVAPFAQAIIDREWRNLGRSPTVAELLSSMANPDTREAMASVLVAMEYVPEPPPREMDEPTDDRRE